MPCAECRKAMEPEERAVEVNRLLLARLGTGPGFLALPTHLPLATRLAWESADGLWRWAGDTATDENHYSKRALLAGILTGALAVQLSSGREAALAFADRRIANVMTFETWKRTTRLKPSQMLDGVATALGRMRYGARAGG